ncbi:pimeloyl-ACP methyl ester carboxylesterase [Streptosporangium album]|uniref:Pimeloyl-ACP methyl ester carboxylesterase n=1 Tax=Streptosporangium album TaxID=47479 RepID=A0A7W7S1Y8_9ACTN|nr:alpha/beta hydrolase family protein [Streptosporangium album]MBB4941708.1 pimeloyl-ACP methyl ester carboxylesterase [Streptosporangium album]
MLHYREWGAGDRVAVLIHGIMADSRCWWRVGPALAERGYRVIAVDLPGHGDSPRAEEYTPEVYASSVLESVPADPDLAIGHSLGGLTLSVAVERLRPGRAVYADPAFRIPKIDGLDLGGMMAVAKDQTVEMVRQGHPGWSAEECALEIEMLAKWDPATAMALDSVAGSDFTPEPVVPSLVQLADPSELVSEEFAETLVYRGFEVRVVKGAEHTIHRHLFENFMAGLEGWI